MDLPFRVPRQGRARRLGRLHRVPRLLFGPQDTVALYPLALLLSSEKNIGSLTLSLTPTDDADCQAHEDE